MRIEPRLLAAFVLGSLAVSGCKQAPLEMGKVDTFGEAYRQTLSAQIVDPAPSYDYSVPEGSGKKASDAIDRYRNDKVKQPDKVKTSTTGADSGSSGK